MHFARAYGASLIAGGPAGFLVISNLAAHPGNLGFDIVTLTALVAITVGTATVYSLIARVEIRGDVVTHVTWNGVTRFTLSEVSRVQKFQFMLATGRPFRLLVIAGVSGRCLLALWGMAWTDTQLDELIRRLGQPRSYWRQFSFYRDARTMCPAGGLPPYVQHPIRYNILVLILVITGLCAAVTVAALHR